MLEKPDMTRAAETAAPPKPAAATPSHRRLLEFALTLAVGATLLAGTLYFVDMRAVGDGLRKIGYGAAVLAGIFAVTQTLICGLRWQLISRQTGAPLRLRDTMLGYVEAQFV